MDYNNYVDLIDNPYPPGTRNAVEWEIGWISRQKEDTDDLPVWMIPFIS